MITTQERATASLESKLAARGYTLVQDLEWGNVGHWSAVPSHDPHALPDAARSVRFNFQQGDGSFTIDHYPNGTSGPVKPEKMYALKGARLAAAIDRIAEWLAPTVVSPVTGKPTKERFA